MSERKNIPLLVCFRDASSFSTHHCCLSSIKLTTLFCFCPSDVVNLNLKSTLRVLYNLFTNYKNSDWRLKFQLWHLSTALCLLTSLQSGPRTRPPGSETHRYMQPKKTPGAGERVGVGAWIMLRMLAFNHLQMSVFIYSILQSYLWCKKHYDL